MTQATIKRNFLTVTQAADRLGVAERTIQHYINIQLIKAEPLDPGRERTIWIIPITEIERFEREREQK